MVPNVTKCIPIDRKSGLVIKFLTIVAGSRAGPIERPTSDVPAPGPAATAYCAHTVHETLTTTNRLLSTAGNTEVEETVPRTGVVLSNDVPMGLCPARRPWPRRA